MVRYYRLCSLTVECVLLLMCSSGRGQGGGMVRLCAVVCVCSWGFIAGVWYVVHWSSVCLLVLVTVW